jgi:hypothetical protein
MKALLTDPVVLICSGILLVGLIGLFWAIGKFRRLSPSSLDTKPFDDLLPPAPDLRDMDFRAPTLSPPPSAAPAVSRDVADKLDSMTQRLTEMQAVLQKQSANAQSQGGESGAMGQGFSPETIDKLLKIIGNVIQQVDVLQKNLGGK